MNHDFLDESVPPMALLRKQFPCPEFPGSSTPTKWKEWAMPSSDNLHTCEGCGDDDLRYYDMLSCSRCHISRCDSCFYHPENDCYDDYCGDCCDWVHDNHYESEYDDDDDDSYDDYGDSCDAVHYYSYRPTLNFKGDRSEPMLGVELEVGGSGHRIVEAVHSVDSSEDHLYMKDDSSISGVEIVTHPMTLAYAREYPFGKLLQQLREQNCYVNSEYGLHIHVDRRAFRTHPLEGKRYGKDRSDMHKMMWLMFTYRNSQQLTKLARRDPSSWGAFHRPRAGELKGKAKGERRGERYSAINCQNANTFEMRFFMSTLSEQEFYAALEFADASVRYTGQIKAADVLRGQAMSWGEFAKWCEKHGYKNLHAEIMRNAA